MRKNMKKNLLTIAFVLSAILPTFAQSTSNNQKDKEMNNVELSKNMQPDAKDNLVRLSKIIVDPAQLDAYNALLKEGVEASMRLEPGVLTLYATAEKENPNKITILEIYTNQEAYKSHLQTPHF